ncbi:tyrosine-type recombinase/integrase [Candidatus Protofrankia californiensis]|uniref:tyrosine-type recombinase/integrase n=1 Tax=Candidatus Protofrankia californiensis TaxID=1839754 RepID=UPI0010419D01|nr:site-specific integrase [Candidatus Protofrankia californiensis]
MEKEGTTYKRCSCRDPNGREQGRTCPKLRRTGGGWNPTHGTWYYAIDLPHHPDGRRRYARRGGFPSQQAAQDQITHIQALLAITGEDDDAGLRRIADLITAAIRGKQSLPGVEDIRRRFHRNADLNPTMTVGQWLDQWLAGRKTIRRSTLLGYTSYVNHHLKPAIGDIRLDRLAVSHLDAMFTAIDERTSSIRAARASTDPDTRLSVRGQRITGNATKQRIRAVLRASLNTAIKRGLITHNPAAHVELASGKRPKALLWTPQREARWRKTGEIPSAVMVWTPAHIGAFLDRAATHRLYPLFRLIAYRGLRRGEACGLHWADIDFDHATIDIRWQIAQLGWATAMDRPKSDAGDRTVPLDTATIGLLHAYRAWQDSERTDYGDGWPDTDLVFTQSDGQPLHPSQVSDLFHDIASALELPPITLRDLRHGAATLALAAGADLKAVQELLGHATITLTADTYTHLLPDLASEIAENVVRLIPRRRKQDDDPDDPPATGLVAGGR